MSVVQQDDFNHIEAVLSSHKLVNVKWRMVNSY